MQHLGRIWRTGTSIISSLCPKTRSQVAVGPYLSTIFPFSSIAASTVSLYGDKCLLPPPLVPELLPKHVAFNLDGSRRWCKSKGLKLDYFPCLRNVTICATLCAKWGIPYATFLMFTTENWRRLDGYSSFFFDQVRDHIEESLESYKRNEMRFKVIGEIHRLPKSLQDTIMKVEEETKDFQTLQLIYPISYGGRRDIVQATRQIGNKIKDGVIDPEQIDEALIKQHFWASSAVGHVIPYPDLMIRTGGRIRLTNFLLWEMAYTELYFTEIPGPEFGENDFINALQSFQQRERSFGR